MKKSLLFLFLLVLGVTQGWAYDELMSAVTVTEDKVYQVTSTRTINGTISVNPGNTLTIYIAKGKTLTVRGSDGEVSTSNAAAGASKPAKPAIEVPSGATLIITGAGTLRVYGGKAATYATAAVANGGAAGAAPAIGGAGGLSSQDRGGAGVNGDPMGAVYIRGNVIVRAARGTSKGRRATTNHGADGCVPTYAIGAGGGGGAARKTTAGVGGVNGTSGDNKAQGTLYIEKTARVIYLNGKIRRVTKFPASTTYNVKYYLYKNDANPVYTQYVKEYGLLNVKNDKYSDITEDKNTLTDGFTTVNVKNVKCWVDAKGVEYNPKDLLVYNGLSQNQTTTDRSVDFPLYAKWDENSSTVFYGIHDAYELTQFAKIVNESGKQSANGILMADINMNNWSSTNIGLDGKVWGDPKPWVPIGAISVQDVKATTGNKPFKGVFDGNGYVVSNLTMANPVVDVTSNQDLTTKWNLAYARAGLIGYAKGATIKNVVVRDATIYGRWQVAAVCGRLDLDGDKGSLINCGSFGNLNLNCVVAKWEYQTGKYYTLTNETKLALDARVVAGVVNADIDGNPVHVSSVWSTYNNYNINEPKADNIWTPQKNYVVATWNTTRNPYWSDYTQNSGTQNDARPKKTWIYVASTNSAWLTNGKLCHDLNGNVDGASAWTQTFRATDKPDASRSYTECPRPTDYGLPVYYNDLNDGNASYYNAIYTVSFDSNGGTECKDVHVKRFYDGTGDLVYPSTLPETTKDNSDFAGWFTENGTTPVEAPLTSTLVSSDITLYAHWEDKPQYINVTANEDPGKDGTGTGNYYCTFFYGEQDYRIITDNVVAYKAKRASGSNNLVMKTLQDKKENVSKVIPAGEAVILKAKTPGIQLQAVQFDESVDPEPDYENALYGSDEEVAVADVRDNIPSADVNSETTYGNCFVFSCVNNTLGFYLPQATTLAAHKAYVLLDGEIYVNSNSTGARPVYMLFEDDLEEDATGISELKSDTESRKAIFSINGMPLSKLQKGINIVGGKKVFVK